MNTKYQIARYEELNQDGHRVWQQYAGGPILRNGMETHCRWLRDTGTFRFALVDQWGFAHQWD